MRQEARNLARGDRLATLHELGQVIGLVIATDQLSLTTLMALESEERRSDKNRFECWTEADRDRMRAATIEHLTNVILGRSPSFN
jgi:hypothetical protein